MFTGIVEEVGEVLAVREVGNGRELRIGARRVLEGTRVGDSISLDGACHTVTSLETGSFTVTSVGTTLGRTTVGEFGVGRKVNLERSLALGDRLGGHLVQGHVDGVGVVRSVTPREELVLIDVEIPREIAELTILHGSIALDGVSLTVNAIPEPEVVQVSIIPHTLTATNFGRLRAGDRVNVEGDMIGKYVRKLLGPPGAGADVPAAPGEDLMKSWGY